MFPVDGFSYIKCKKQKTENEISDKCLDCLFCLLVCWFSVVFFVCSGLSVSGKDKLNRAWLLRRPLFFPQAKPCSAPILVVLMSVLETQCENWWHFSVSSNFSIICQIFISNASLVRSGLTLLVFVMCSVFLFIYFSAHCGSLVNYEEKEPCIKLVILEAKRPGF